LQMQKLKPELYKKIKLLGEGTYGKVPNIIKGLFSQVKFHESGVRC
jgi:hypothetical protein